MATELLIESKIDKGKGPVSTILVTNGKLKKVIISLVVRPGVK